MRLGYIVYRIQVIIFESIHTKSMYTHDTNITYTLGLVYTLTFVQVQE